jgi:hypothetical protein
MGHLGHERALNRSLRAGWRVTWDQPKGAEIVNGSELMRDSNIFENRRWHQNVWMKVAPRTPKPDERQFKLVTLGCY